MMYFIKAIYFAPEESVMKRILGLIVGVLLTIVPVTSLAQANVPAGVALGIEPVRFRLDAARSTFMVHANRAGLAWFKGHSHRIAVKDFSGEVSLALDALNPASLELTVRVNSLEETDPVFTREQKAIIKKELDELVLESAKYPEIKFKSTDVNGSITHAAFDVQIGGELTLHGVTRHITIPARVTLDGDSLRAVGEFEINRKKYGVKATTAARGLVRIRHGIKFKFDIIGTRV
jgi:polyisoprenoid-binding protein YceI